MLVCVGLGRREVEGPVEGGGRVRGDCRPGTGVGRGLTRAEDFLRGKGGGGGMNHGKNLRVTDDDLLHSVATCGAY
jgi:hypothetical protein